MKMHKGKKQGLAYSQSIQVLNSLCLLTHLKSLHYDEYIIKKKRDK